MVRGIDHIELVVRDVEQFASLFESMGFEVILRTPHHGGSIEVKLPGEGQTIFELHSVEGEENPGVNHIAFGCDNVHETYEAMKKKGIVFEKAPFLVPATGRLIANFRDPDGWRLQLVDAKRSTDIKEDTRPEQGRESDVYRQKPKF